MRALIVITLFCMIGYITAISRACRPICFPQEPMVCGTNGVTYKKRCYLYYAACKDKSIKVAYKGKCKNPLITKCARICNKNYSPVCGSDGKTYPNDCIRKEAQCIANKPITVVRKGKCCGKACPRTYSPVCGNNGKTYDNRCSLEIADCKSSKRILVASYGFCKSDPCDNIPCPRIAEFDYCAHDGKVYGNVCDYIAESCRTKTAIILLYSGKCRMTSNRCNFNCKSNGKAVCGSDNNSYANMCALKKRSCQLGMPITAVKDPSDGRCGDCPRCPSSAGKKPSKVCGSDRNLYDSECHMNRKACQMKKAIIAINYGSCPTS